VGRVAELVSFGVMSTISPVLACGSMHFSTGDLAVIYSVVGSWLIGCVLAFANLCLITVLDTATRVKIAHLVFFSFYAFCAFGLFTGWFGNLSAWYPLIPIFGVPVLVILHFSFLLWLRKRLRRKSLDS